LIFGCSRDTDVVVPVTTTQYSIDALKLSKVLERRRMDWWRVRNQKEKHIIETI